MGIADHLTLLRLLNLPILAISIFVFYCAANINDQGHTPSRSQGSSFITEVQILIVRNPDSRNIIHSNIHSSLLIFPGILLCKFLLSGLFAHHFPTNFKEYTLPRWNQEVCSNRSQRYTVFGSECEMQSLYSS